MARISYTAAAVLAALTSTWTTTVAWAGDSFTYLGPTAYTSSDDSPFSIKSFGFCVETFEDSTFNVPAATGDGTIVEPSGLTDSVDGDDGSIDGFGTAGHSYFSGNGPAGITFTFTEGRPNGYPTQVGIVWTDGGGAATVSFEAFGANGSSLGVHGPFLHGDLLNTGQTGEDRFYGVQDGGGISKINIRNTTGGGGIEVDHLQLDACIVCGDANSDTHISASDALIALKTSVGSETCLFCVCDTNNSASNTATDALNILKKSVGLTPTMNCPSCDF